MRCANIPGISQPAAVICLGTAMMNDAFDIARAHRILDMYQDIGGNFIDTARVYGLTGDGHSLSERCVGDWLKARGNRERIVLTTKGGHYDLATRASRLSPTDITSDCEASLRDLGVDFIDLYWLHRDDERRPVEEIIDTLNALRCRGLIGALGASNWSAARMAAANEYAARSGQAGFVADQPQWSLARQFVCDDDTLVQMNAELYAFHARTGMAVVPFSSQAKGFYSKLAQGGLDALSDKARVRFARDENLRKLPVVQELARAHGVTVGAIALGYLTGQPFPVFPIVGITREQYIDDVRAAGELRLSPEEVSRLAEA